MGTCMHSFATPLFRLGYNINFSALLCRRSPEAAETARRIDDIFACPVVMTALHFAAHSGSRAMRRRCESKCSGSPYVDVGS